MKLIRCIETDRAFYRRLFIMALPLAAQNIVTMGVNLADNVMLGQLGETAMTAATLANRYIALYQFCIMGISMGSSVLTSRFWGMRDTHALRQTVTIALRMAGIMSVVVAVFSAIFAPWIMGIYSHEGAVVAQGIRYLRWSTPTFVLTGLSTVCTNVLRSVNLAKIPLLASVLGFTVNIGANYIFIFGKLGAPAMGVAGAALGTVIARVLETGIICGYFFVRDGRIGYKLKNLLGECRGLVGEYLRISLPVLVSDGLLGVGDSALAIVVGHIGQQFVAATSITDTIQRVSMVFISSISFSSCFLTGQVLGEGQVEKAKQQATTYLLLGVAIGVVGALFIQMIKGPLIGIYNIAPETQDISHALMNAISIIVVFRASNSILTKGVLRGGGDTRFLMAADVLFLWVIAIPLGAVAGLVWHLPPFWVYVCLYVDQIIKAIWCIFRLRSGKWIKHISSGIVEKTESECAKK